MAISFFSTKLIFSIIALLSKLLAFSISRLLFFSTLADLSVLFLGGIFLSSSFVHILPNTIPDFHDSYPYSSLISLTIFAFLTLFCFIRDSIVLMDENVLSNTDSSNHRLSLHVDLLEPPRADPETEKFSISENLPTVLLYVIVLTQTVASTIALSAVDSELFGRQTGLLIAEQFLELIAVGQCLCRLPISRLAFWILAAIVAIVPAGMLIAVGKIQKVSYFAGIGGSMLAGFYFFLGVHAVHEGIANLKRNVWLVVGVLLLAFVAPIGIRTAEL